MHRPWSRLRAVLLACSLTSCTSAATNSACYVFVWNATVTCWPEEEHPVVSKPPVPPPP